MLGGSGELHLMIAHERLVQEHRIDCVLQEFQLVLPVPIYPDNQIQ